MTNAREETLKHVLCIHYSVRFKKGMTQALIDSENEVNAIYPNFVKQLGLLIQPTDVRAQKIDDTMLDIYKMVVAVFSVLDKAN